MSIIHKDSQDCQCAGCQAASIEGMDERNIIDIVKVIMKHGGKVVSSDTLQKPSHIKVIKIEDRKKLTDKKAALYEAMMDDAGIPMDQRI